MIDQIKAFAGEYRIAGVKTFNGMEGGGWEGQLFRNGNFIGLVGDDATGGPIRIDINNGVERNALDSYAAKVSKGKYERTESFIDDLVNYQVSVKRLQGQAKKIILAIVEDNPKVDENGVPQECTTFKVAYTPQTCVKVLAKYPNAKILNDAILAFEIPRAVRNPKA
jgi:hypothetical protein